MFWFDGPIRNAVDKVKSTGVFLLVFVKGKDVLSQKYETVLNEEIKISKNGCVAIKISEDSTAFKWLKEIYIDVPIPSVFLIKNNGIPISIVSSDKTCDVINAISDAIQKEKVNILEDTKAEKDKENEKQKEKEEVVVRKEETEKEIKQKKVDIKGKEIRKEKSSENQKEKTKLGNKIELNGCVNPNQNKTSTHKEEISKNLENVKNVGHRIIEVTEEEIRQRLNEIRSFPRFLLIQNCSLPSDPLDCSSSPKAQSARIQFRFPDNEMPAWEFPNLSTLSDVRAYLMEKKKLSKFKLLRTYPRVPFTPQDENKTLTELSLTPSATLIVVPYEHESIQAKVKNILVRQNLMYYVIGSLFQPLFYLFKYFKKHILRIPEDRDDGPRRLKSDTAIEKRTNKKTSTTNIRGFKFNDDDVDSDAENPDNGNSTQQHLPR